MKEDKIEVGEYVRTKKKGIFKVLSIRKTPYGYYCGIVDNDNIRTFTIGKGGNTEIKNDIVKHSKNIIDLICCGDYINGDKVIAVSNVTGWIDTEQSVIYKDHIKSIVTKEQFKSIEYRLES